MLQSNVVSTISKMPSNNDMYENTNILHPKYLLTGTNLTDTHVMSFKNLFSYTYLFTLYNLCGEKYLLILIHDIVRVIIQFPHVTYEPKKY